MWELSGGGRRLARMVLGSSGGTVFGVLLAVVMVAGYVALWALWHFVFRKAPPDDHQQDKPPPSE